MMWRCTFSSHIFIYVILKEWLEKKAAKDAELKRLEKQRKDEEAREKKEKEDKCKKAVEKWMAEAKERPRTAPNSFGYCAGKLRG